MFRKEYPDPFASQYVPYSQDIRDTVDGGHTAFAPEEPSSTRPRSVRGGRANVHRPYGRCMTVTDDELEELQKRSVFSTPKENCH